MQIALSPYAASGSGAPAAGPDRGHERHQPRRGGSAPAGRLQHGPQRLEHLAAGQRGQRPGDQVGTLPVGQQLVHVTGAEDKQLQVRHPSRLMTPVWLSRLETRPDNDW